MGACGLRPGAARTGASVRAVRFPQGAAVLWQRGETSNRVLVDHHLLKTELSALAEAMEGTVAQSIVDPANPKTALSVRRGE